MKKSLFLIISSILCIAQCSILIFAQQQYDENEFLFEESSFYNKKLITQAYNDELFVLNTDTHHLFRISNNSDVSLFVEDLVTNFSISNNVIHIIKEDNTIDFLDIFYSFSNSAIIPDIKNYNRTVVTYNLESRKKLDEFYIKFECDNNGMYLYQISNKDRFDANVMMRSNSIGLGSLIHQETENKFVLLDFPVFQFSVREDRHYALINDDSNGKLIHISSTLSKDSDERLNQITSNYIDENVFYFIDDGNLIYYLKESSKEVSSDLLQGNLYSYNEDNGEIKILVEAKVNDFALADNAIIYSSISNCGKNSIDLACGLYSFDGKDTAIVIENKEILTFQINNNKIVAISKNKNTTNLELYVDNQLFTIESY